MIDIIIPAYNAHKTITKTLFSICLQDIKDKINVYIIDDNSKEKYDYLLDDFKDELKITLYRNDKNIGPGASRNKGLELSKGKYIMFLDSDDLLVSPLSLNSLVKEMTNADIAIGVLLMENSDGSVEYIKNHDRCLHAKLYKRDFLEKYHIRFNNSYRHEDSTFHELCLFAEPKITLVDASVYYYAFNKNSLIHTKSGLEEYQNYEMLANNTLWAAEEGLKRNFDEKNILTIIEGTLMYLYFCYQDNYQYNYADKMFEWNKPLVAFYNKHKKILDEKITFANYKVFANNYEKIPYISWYEFIKRSS